MLDFFISSTGGGASHDDGRHGRPWRSSTRAAMTGATELVPAAMAARGSGAAGQREAAAEAGEHSRRPTMVGGARRGGRPWWWRQVAAGLGGFGGRR
jgi:hypothetical protein